MNEFHDKVALEILWEMGLGLQTEEQQNSLRGILQDRLTDLGPSPVVLHTVPDWFRRAWMRGWGRARRAWRRRNGRSALFNPSGTDPFPLLGQGNQSGADVGNELGQFLNPGCWDHWGTTLLLGLKCVATEPYAEPGQVVAAIRLVASVIHPDSYPWWAVVQPGHWHLTTVRGVIFEPIFDAVARPSEPKPAKRRKRKGAA